MKNLKLLAFWILFFMASTSGWSQQFRPGIILGVSPGSSPNNVGIILNRQIPSQEFTFNMYKVKPQIFGGVKMNMQMSYPFFAELGIMYSQRSTEYFTDYTHKIEGRAATVTMNETDHMLLMPVSIGVTLGSFDVTSGFTAMGTVASKSDLSQINGFESNNDFLDWGWQAGVRYTIKRSTVGLERSMIGIEYQGSFSRVGHGASVYGQSLELMNIPGHIAVTLQHNF